LDDFYELLAGVLVAATFHRKRNDVNDVVAGSERWLYLSAVTVGFSATHTHVV